LTIIDVTKSISPLTHYHCVTSESQKRQIGEDIIKRFFRIGLVLTATALMPASAQSQTKIEFWHAMSGALGERVESL
jgi:hypothetical protein